LDQIADVGVSQSQNLKLLSCEITFEVFLCDQSISTLQIQMDRETTYRGITTLCVALHGKNCWTTSDYQLKPITTHWIKFTKVQSSPASGTFLVQSVLTGISVLRQKVSR